MNRNMSLWYPRELHVLLGSHDECYQEIGYGTLNFLVRDLRYDFAQHFVEREIVYVEVYYIFILEFCLN